MKKITNTLQTQLINRYSGVLTIVLTLCFMVLCFFYIQNEYSSTTNYLNTLNTSVTDIIDQEIDNFSTLSLNTIYSKTLKNNIASINPDKPDYTLISGIYSIIGSIIGPNSSAAQINVYSKNNYVVGWGTFSYAHSLKLNEQSWYPTVKSLHGNKYITAPFQNKEFIRINPNMRDKYYISMIRMYFDSAYNEEGIVEVMQDCTSFFSYADNLQKENSQLSIQIIDSEGTLIYPYLNSKEYQNLNTLIETKDLESSVVHLAYVNNSLCFIEYQISESTGWKIISTLPFSFLIYKIIPFLAILIIALILFLTISVLVSFKIARSLLLPLESLKDQLEKTNLDEILAPNQSLIIETSEETPAEIASLIRVYNIMSESLKKTSRNILHSKEEETKAKLYAMQSMLNPHFLYNSLTNISIMAENDMRDQITGYCHNLSKYIRYISSDDLQKVTFATELKYTIAYLDCMKTRYGDKLVYMIDCSSEVMNIQLPKLTLQPLIENSLKYAFHNSPPWIICISGKIMDGVCFISISDNGVGFSVESLLEQQKNLQEIRETKDIHSIKIGGLGIKNVLLRLLFLYGDSSELLLSGCHNSGAKIVIKIPIGEK